MRCTGYEMARYKGTQASHLYEKSMHTLCTISEQPLLAEASTYPRPKSITHLRTFSDNGVYVALRIVFFWLRPLPPSFCVNNCYTMNMNKKSVQKYFITFIADVWYQFDSMIFPKPDSGLIATFKDWLRNDTEKRMSEANLALGEMLPRWKHLWNEDGRTAGDSFLRYVHHAYNSTNMCFRLFGVDINSLKGVSES